MSESAPSYDVHAHVGLDPGFYLAGWWPYAGRPSTIAHHTPNGRIPDAAVCGPAAVHLVSDDAPHTHGQMLRVDGGMSAWQHPNPMDG
jgi:NAD(P)-dependent dehydrogenase (short-subunit alcohol dehydrogenase family)